MHRRNAVTLVEVLVAIFIMGIGLMALLTLFPLGALSMAKAVRDDRAAAIAANGASQAVIMDLRNDTAVGTAMTSPASLNASFGALLPPDPNGPSYPAFVDPNYAILGSQLVGTNSLTVVNGSAGLAHRTRSNSTTSVIGVRSRNVSKAGWRITTG